MWGNHGNPTLFYQAKSIEKISRKDRYLHNQSGKVFFTEQRLLKKNLRKCKYWNNQLRKASW